MTTPSSPPPDQGQTGQSASGDTGGYSPGTTPDPAGAAPYPGSPGYQGAAPYQSTPSYQGAPPYQSVPPYQGTPYQGTQDQGAQYPGAPYQAAGAGYPDTPAYPAAPAYANAPGQTGIRPGMATAAAVLAFISGGLGIIFGLIGFSLLSSISVGGIYVVLIIVSLVLSCLLIWGGVQALGGKDGRILVGVAGLAILINLIEMIIYFDTGSLLGLVIPILIIAFMLNPQVKAWIQSKGGQTF